MLTDYLLSQLGENGDFSKLYNLGESDNLFSRKLNLLNYSKDRSCLLYCRYINIGVYL